MEHVINPGVGAATAADEFSPNALEPAAASTSVPADGVVPEATAVEALRARQAVLESRLARAEEENQAFVRTLRHAAAAAEELLDEARAEAQELVETARAEAQHLVETARADATRVRASAETTAVARLMAADEQVAELLVVARADARDAFEDERLAIATSRDELVAAEQAIAADRTALVRLHGELTGGLRSLVRAMTADLDAPAGAAPALVPAAPVAPVFNGVDAATFAATVRTGPQVSADPIVVTDEAVTDLVQLPASADRPDPRHDDEHLERAFDEFFSSDVEHEPSRAWILED